MAPPPVSSGYSEPLLDEDGSIFDSHYQVLNHELGIGASGVAVREGECRRTGRRVAVKTYNKRAMKAADENHLKSEVDVLRGLAHAGIVQVEAVYQSQSTVRIVMERLYGGELFHLVSKKGHISERVAAQTVRQLLEALVYLHERRIVHRDIKLENVMLAGSESPKVKLIDFGFATKMSPGAKLEERCGTVQYVAPEVRAGRSYDETVDIWSVGSVLFTALTGAHLYQGREAEITRKAKHGLVDYNQNRRFSALTWGAQRFLKQLLQVTPENRPSAQDALKDPWLRQHSLAAEERLKTLAGEPGQGKGSFDKVRFIEIALKALTVGVMSVCALDDDDD